MKALCLCTAEMEAAYSAETLVPIKDTKRHHIPKGHYLV